jgi:transcriptional regulator with GAF, ATPase, and Fis domain
MEIKNEHAVSFTDLYSSKFSFIEQLFEQNQFGISILGPDLRYLHVNDRMAIISGFPVDQHIGKTVYELDPQIAEAIGPILSRTINEGQSYIDRPITVPRSPRFPASKDRFWLVSCYPQKENNGTVWGCVLLAKDIAEQKARENDQAERLKFEALLSDLSSDFINVAVSEVDRKIEEALQKVAGFLEFDRCSIWRLSPDDGKLVLTHFFGVPGIKPLPPVIVDSIPEWLNLVRKGEIFEVADTDDMPDNFWREKEYCKVQGGIKSILFIPVRVGGQVTGTINFVSHSVKREWPDELIQRLRLLWDIFSNALERKHANQKIQNALAEIKQLRNRLEAENIYLRDQIDTEYMHDEIIGISESIQNVLSQAGQVAKTNATVLILGETGTGKELIARAIHSQSSRKSRAMIKVNCAALPSALIEAELFGHEKGAYTGALSSRIGRFEAANGSTIFLDEIGELPLDLQSKLLRVLQEGQFERLGSHKPIDVDIRVIAATNRSLAQAVRDGSFREDLYYRLNVFPIFVPTLRERREDIPMLAWAMVKEFSKEFGKTIDQIPRKNMEAMERYHWPGNIRELRNLVERAMILCSGTTLVIDVPDMSVTSSALPMTIESVERLHIISVLEKTGWRIRGTGGAAEILGLKPTTLNSRMKKLGIRRQSAPTEGVR